MNVYQSEELQALIKQVNSMIDLLMMVARKDLTQTINFLREGVGNSQISAQTQTIIVEHMQSFDLFSQRTEHMKTIHLWIFANLKKRPVREQKKSSEVSLLRLNQLQLHAALSDYLENIQSIQQAFTTTHSPEQVEAFNKARLLKDTTMMAASAHPFMEKKFEEASKIAEGYADINAAEIHELETIYSMQSERIILQAYLNNPYIQEADLKNNMDFENQPSTIDLF